MLREFVVGDVLAVEPVDFAAVSRGDVVVFTPPGETESVVHRVVAATPAGLKTAGDNNARCDTWILTPEVSLRLVVERRDRSGRRHPVARGAAGMRKFYFHRVRRSGYMVLAHIANALLRFFPGRRELPEPEVFGDDFCYFYRGKLIAKRHGDGPLVWVKKFYKLRFYGR